MDYSRAYNKRDKIRATVSISRTIILFLAQITHSREYFSFRKSWEPYLGYRSSKGVLAKWYVRSNIRLYNILAALQFLR